MPEAAIGADVMVGFPGETDDDFEQTRALIESLPFTYLHVFTYSSRPGTPSAAMPSQVPAMWRTNATASSVNWRHKRSGTFRKGSSDGAGGNHADARRRANTPRR